MGQRTHCVPGLLARADGGAEGPAERTSVHRPDAEGPKSRHRSRIRLGWHTSDGAKGLKARGERKVRELAVGLVGNSR
jgi:hypothetical protein